VGGVLLPFRTEQMSGDSVLASLAWETIEVNEDVPDEWFSPPPSTRQAAFTEFRHEMLSDGLDGLDSEYANYRKVADAQLDQQLENELNTFGYELISHERYKDAIKVFELAVRQHPTSSNLHDSLGEAYLLDADTARSVIHYRKSLELNRNNGHAADVLAEISDQHPQEADAPAP
jgi:tetratricopeptide (TPR) repeat protein